MSSDVDAIVDRRRLRRKLTLWRVLAILALVAGIGGIVAVAGGTKFVAQSSPHVARITVGGLIRNDRDRLEMLDDMPWYFALGDRFLMGVKDRQADLEKNMTETLQRLKSASECRGAST